MKQGMKNEKLKQNLERLYNTYNRREYVNPDPLLFLYDYPDRREREIAGFIAAALAYGRVESIMQSVGIVLKKMGPSPADYLETRILKDMLHDFAGFVYRFAKTRHLAAMLWELKGITGRFGSLENCFLEGMGKNAGSVLPGLVFFYQQMEDPTQMGHLLADPEKNSACKRMHLYLRWMVRKDKVDPGGWNSVSPESLMVPLDTHMYDAGRLLGFTNRKSMDKKTVQEITRGFQSIKSDDPVKYDFCLTRFGINRTLEKAKLADELIF